jgi:NADH-quinone oxidoreductase subunit G
MTVTVSRGAGTGEPVPSDLVEVVIDGLTVAVPKGTLVIRAAEQLGIAIPRFCDHPLLDPVGACRQCLVEIGTPGPDGELRWMPKPQASCTVPVAPGMQVRTQLTSPVADKAQQGIMEFLLLNHPLDCPVCDKGGECPLQNQAMSNGRPEARFDGVKRTYPKPIAISSQVLLDRERCVLCARCTRFSDQIAGDPFIELLERGALQQVGIYEEQPFESYFSGNTIQICPVGALTSATYRFRARPFDLVSTPTTCEHCASGCALRVDHRRGRVMRRLAAEDPAVNQEWSCDKGRFAFTYASAVDRLTHPLVRDAASGELRPASWPEALRVAADGLRRAQAAGGVGVLPGGRLTVEDAYAYAKFARVVLDTNDVDARWRGISAEEQEFLASSVAGTTVLDGSAVGYADLEAAPAVVTVGFEAEEESPIVFLRLRAAVRARGTAVHVLAPFATLGTRKLDARLVPTAPGTEAEVLDAIAAGGVGRSEAIRAAAEAVRVDGAIVLVGERAATSPGALSALVRLADATGVRVAWIPRRAGERGAVEAGALPALLPGGRPAGDAAARVDVATAWGAHALPPDAGRDTDAILRAAADGTLGGLLLGGVDVGDHPDPTLVQAALARAGFVVSLEIRASEVHDAADVVLPVAAVVEKDGTFVDWEGRPRPVRAALDTPLRPDAWVLARLADELGRPLGLADAAAARAELAEIGPWDGPRPPAPTVPAGTVEAPPPGSAVLATWKPLLDAGRMQDGEPNLAGTARTPLAHCSAGTAADAGLVDGQPVAVSSAHGTVELPLQVVDMPDGVVWLPQHSRGCLVHPTLAVSTGGVVTLRRAAAGTDASDSALTAPGASQGGVP